MASTPTEPAGSRPLSSGTTGFGSKESGATTPRLPVRRGDGVRLSRALGDAVSDLYARGSAASKATALWGEAVGPMGLRHTRGIFVKEADVEGAPPTLYVYLDSNAFVYEYTTDAILYEQRLANLGFPVRRLVFQLSRSVGSPTSPTSAGTVQWSPASSGTTGPGGIPSPMDAGEPRPRPLEELRPLDATRERWARESVRDLPKDLGDAVYGAMTSSLRRNQDAER